MHQRDFYLISREDTLDSTDVNAALKREGYQHESFEVKRSCCVIF
jgi:hypothetical protein